MCLISIIITVPFKQAHMLYVDKFIDVSRLQLFSYEMKIYKNMLGPLMQDKIRGTCSAF